VASAEEVAEFFGVETFPSFQAQYIVAPGQVVAVVNRVASDSSELLTPATRPSDVGR
jgi:hypothetical protein